MTRLAEDYCALLRANEETIALRDVDARRAAADPGRVARWLTRGTEGSVAATLLALPGRTWSRRGPPRHRRRFR